MKKIEEHKKYFFISIIIIVLGINFSTVMKDPFGSLGTVFIAIGGLFFIIALNKKREANKKNNK